MSDYATPYVAAKPRLARSSDELRAEIPGWGADLDHANRPSVPREQFNPGATGAHWEFPELQQELELRERSIEHAMLTPVFGTTVPLRGLSGAVRRLAYERFSEGRAAHWLLLLAGDRIDAAEQHLASFATLRPDNPITETGVRVEAQHGASRFGRGRADLKHGWLDPIIVAGPWVLAAGAAVLAVRAVAKRF